MYRFADKYGANVDGYSPIYTPDTWSESGEWDCARCLARRGGAGLGSWCGATERCRYPTPLALTPLPPPPPPTPTPAGESYKLGTKGLVAWAGLIVVLLGVGINLVVSTSAIGQ